MNKKIITALFTLMLFCTVKSKATGEDPSRTALYNLREKITSIVASIPVSLSNTEDSETFLVTFQVKEDNVLSLISVEGCDEYVSAQIRRKLEGLNTGGPFDHLETYKIKVVFKKQGA